MRQTRGRESGAMMISNISMVSSQQVRIGIFYPRQVTLHIRSNLPRRPWTRTPSHTNHYVGLLKDRACAEEEPDRKKARIEEYRLKK